MRILCDIGHPAHIHLFKNLLWELEKRGHEYLITTRDKDVTLKLLKKYGMPFTSFGRRYVNIWGKIFGLMKFNNKMLKTAKTFKPDIFISHGSMYAAQVACFTGKPHISLEDTNNMEQIRLYEPFTKVILTSTCFPKKFGKKQVQYDGYHELAYLHPSRFCPDPGILDTLGIRRKEKYVILRFVLWKATHDITHGGISIDAKVRLVREFSKYARVFISSEEKLSEGLMEYQINIPPEDMHDALYYAALLYGESGTMASECAMLGTPAIFLDNTGRLYTDEQERKYGLVHNFSESSQDQDRSMRKGIELLRHSGTKKEFAHKRVKMLKDKIDVTAFLVWYIENFPSSYSMMKDNPHYQLRFRDQTQIGECKACIKA